MTKRNPLKDYLKQDGVRQIELATAMSKTRWTIRRWANGETPIPVGAVSKLSELTGIPVPTLRPDLAEKFGGRA
jgi:transcriptional regulator with XRE-family HTH domain